MEEYLGFKEVVPTDEQLAELFSGHCPNLFGCLQNEYLIARDTAGEVLATLRCDGDFMSDVPFKTIKSNYLGEIKPRNIQQKLAVNMLYNKNETIKILAGCFGSGEFFAPLRGNVQMNIL